MSGQSPACRLAAVAAVLGLSIHVAAQSIPTHEAPPGPRTGMIVGQVVDASTGAPISEAVVRLTMPKAFGPNDRVMADGDGRFFFADLPKGEYFVQATRDGYAPGTYGQRQAWGQNQLLSLGEGERLSDVQLRLWKYGAIGGTVVDEAGEPAVGIAVRALVRNVIAGRTRFGSMAVTPELVPSATTDDRGMFRLSQLSPGTYVVVVPSTQTTLPATALQSPDAALRSDLFFSGVAEVGGLGQPRTQQFGDAAMMTLSRVLIPPPPSPSGRMQVYRTTYYPAATTASAATPIAIDAGQERTDISIALQPVSAVRVSGRLMTPDGSAPPPTTIRLVGDGMADVVTATRGTGVGYVPFETVTAMSDAAGQFTILGVPPGEYVLKQADGFLSRKVRDGAPAYCVSQRITIGTDDLINLTVQLRAALRVEGRVELRSANHPPSAPPRFTGVYVTFETPFAEPGQFVVATERAPGLPFSTIAAEGQYIARPIELDGWFVQSVTAAGKDITDRVFNLQTDVTSLVVTYTDRPSRVSGRVTDAQGAASPTAMVLAFPVNPSLWSGYGASPRNLKSALTSRTGVYTFDHLPADDYYVIAIDPAEADNWQDPTRLEALASQATELTIGTSETSKTLDLRLKAIR